MWVLLELAFRSWMRLRWRDSAGARLAEGLVENRQADIHPIVDVGVVVVELLVGVRTPAAERRRAP
jgi:hypothetical protein